jgi:aspartate aminotransferase-like enzyme
MFERVLGLMGPVELAKRDIEGRRDHAFTLDFNRIKEIAQSAQSPFVRARQARRAPHETVEHALAERAVEGRHARHQGRESAHLVVRLHRPSGQQSGEQEQPLDLAGESPTGLIDIPI